MKRFLISSIIFPILIFIAGACAPALSATSVPSETPTLPATTTPLPPATSAATDAPKSTNTPELYTLNTDPNHITGPALTMDDINGKLTAWAKEQPECKNPKLDVPKTVDPINGVKVEFDFSHSDIPGLDYAILQPIPNLINNKYVTQTVSETCSYHYVNPLIWDFDNKENVVLILENTEDINGKEGMWQLITGIERSKRIAQENKTQLYPYDKLVDANNKGFLDDDANSRGDNRSMVTKEIEKFYKNQGTSLKEVQEAFRIFATGGYDAPFPFTYSIVVF